MEKKKRASPMIPLRPIIEPKRVVTRTLRDGILLKSLRGLRSLIDLNADKLLPLDPPGLSTYDKELANDERTTKQSRQFQASFKYAFLPCTNPIAVTLRTNSVYIIIFK